MAQGTSRIGEAMRLEFAGWQRAEVAQSARGHRPQVRKRLEAEKGPERGLGEAGWGARALRGAARAPQAGGKTSEFLGCRRLRQVLPKRQGALSPGALLGARPESLRARPGGSNDPEERASASGTRSRRATETRKHAAPDGGISKRSQRSRKMRTRRGEPSIR